jgi:hypothetical protein
MMRISSGLLAFGSEQNRLRRQDRSLRTRQERARALSAPVLQSFNSLLSDRD